MMITESMHPSTAAGAGGTKAETGTASATAVDAAGRRTNLSIPSISRMVRASTDTWQFIERLQLVVLATMFWLVMNLTFQNTGGLGLQLPFNSLFLLAGCGFLLLSLYPLLFKKSVELNLALVLPLIFVSAAAVALLFNDRSAIENANHRLVSLLLGVVFVLALSQLQQPQRKAQLIRILFISTVIQTLWGLVQYYLVYEPHPLFLNADGGLPLGVFQQVNVFSSYLATGSAMAFYYLMTEKRPLGHLQSLLYVALIGANAHLLVLADVQTGRIVLIASTSLLVLLWLAYARGHLRLAQRQSAVKAASSAETNIENRVEDHAQYKQTRQHHQRLIGVVVLATVVGLLMPKAWFDVRPAGLVEEDFFKENTIGARHTIYNVTLRMIAEKPLTGHGIGRFMKAYGVAQGEYLKEHPSASIPRNMQHPHNEILFWVAELGVLVLLAMVAMVYVVIRALIQQRLCWARLSLVLPILVHMMGELPLYTSLPHYFALLALFWAAQTDTAVVKTLANKLHTKALVMLAIVPLVWVSASYSVQSLHALLLANAFNKAGAQFPEIINQITKPGAFRREYPHILYHHLLNREKERGSVNKQLVDTYAAWAINAINHTPWEPIYEDLLDCLNFAGRHEEAHFYAKEALLIYPQNDMFQRATAYYEGVGTPAQLPTTTAVVVAD